MIVFVRLTARASHRTEVWHGAERRATLFQLTESENAGNADAATLAAASCYLPKTPDLETLFCSRRVIGLQE
jgi:hypothetical protein